MPIFPHQQADTAAGVHRIGADTAVHGVIAALGIHVDAGVSAVVESIIAAAAVPIGGRPDIRPAAGWRDKQTVAAAAVNGVAAWPDQTVFWPSPR